MIASNGERCAGVSSVIGWIAVVAIVVGMSGSASGGSAAGGTGPGGPLGVFEEEP